MSTKPSKASTAAFKHCLEREKGDDHGGSRVGLSVDYSYGRSFNSYAGVCYQQTELRARMHIALRAESGQVTQTVEYITKANASYPIDHRGGQVFYASSVEFSKKGILNRRTKELSAHKYADDEAMFVRMVDLAQIKEQADEK